MVPYLPNIESIWAVALALLIGVIAYGVASEIKTACRSDGSRGRGRRR